MFDTLESWFTENRQLVGWLFTISIATLILAVTVIPLVVARMSADYFMPDRNPGKTLARQHPVLRWIGLILKNVLGFLLVLLGLVLSLPFVFGQGLLTILIGLMVMDFPGKRSLELRLVRFSPLKKGIDWIRAKAGRDPLQLPEEE